MSEYTTEHKAPLFTLSDVELLTSIGGALVRSATLQLVAPDVREEVRADAQLRLDNGNAVLEIRDKVRAMLS